ncbi:ZSWM1 protein, partial [Rhinopomastus cyanomelas]|nr:ZSWM1 protein [Rhinopomastus cyanomelas]
RDLEIVTGGLSKIFSAELCLERCITSLGQYYQQCVFKNLPDAKLCFIPHPDDCPGKAVTQSLLAPGSSFTPLPHRDQPLQCPVQASAQQQQLVPVFPTMTEIPVIALQSLPAAPHLLTALQHQPKSPQALLQSELTSSQFLLDPSSTSGEQEATENAAKGSVKQINHGTEECIKQSLSEICTEPAARLCLSEFAVVQKSVQVISVAEDGFTVQILEDAHSVSLEDQRSCTCHFSQAFQLPCRHILALLHSEKRTVQPDMLGAQWQKGQDAHQAGQDSADGLLEILESSWDEYLDKSLLVSFLTAEVSRLLTCCSGTEFECRYRTLRELADSWIGPYVVVKL